MTGNHQSISDILINISSVIDKITSKNCLMIITYVLTIPVTITISDFKNPFPEIKIDRKSSNEVEKFVESLKSKNSRGYDEIPIETLKINSPFISVFFNSYSSVALPWPRPIISLKLRIYLFVQAVFPSLYWKHFFLSSVALSLA